MPKLHIHTFDVRPKGKYSSTFPIDMLRYDGCHPATEEDSVKIMSTMPILKKEAVTVTISRVASKNWSPTYDRWKSFGWEVTVYEIKPLI